MLTFLEHFETFAAFVALIVLITEFFVRTCNIKKSWLKQVISWSAAIIMAAIATLGCFGIFGILCGLPEWQKWLYAAMIAIGAGLASNGIYDIPFIQTALEKITDFINWIVSLFRKKPDDTFGSGMATT